jgi:predicted alpha/beta-fold hydrolase
MRYNRTQEIKNKFIDCQLDIFLRLQILQSSTNTSYIFNLFFSRIIQEEIFPSYYIFFQMYIRLYNPRLHLSLFSQHVKTLSTITSNILKPYPNYVERQLNVAINTSSGDEFIEIDRETSVKVAKPATFVRTMINYVDTNPLGDKNQPIVLLVHGYPGTHESTKNLIEEFQRRNFRCIAPDMPC